MLQINRVDKKPLATRRSLNHYQDFNTNLIFVPSPIGMIQVDFCEPMGEIGGDFDHYILMKIEH